ncbi:WD-40 repeat-containing protein MSI4-like [Senna tora]|uniref:WD-40 repeat-containing protein MSI4-like n=1 Tax=Senna tora TaxID=362788 RepID=A0A834WEE3_9FABA|nr:WD-40 repeat-containing protein MSI4-like [Senna tora]
MSSNNNNPIDKRYLVWRSVIASIYDSFTNHNLVWPTLSCRQGRPKFTDEESTKICVLIGSLGTDGSAPNTLIATDCSVFKTLAASSSQITEFDEENRSPYVKRHKAIIHPGEVNKIREVPQKANMVVTKTDIPEVLVWDFDAQPARHVIPGATDSRPDLVLVGHIDRAEFALVTCPTEPYVISGGRDTSIVLWNLNDEAKLAKHRPRQKFAGNKYAVSPRGIFVGHTNTVEDIQFCPHSSNEFCSVGDDHKLLFWDIRVGVRPVIKVQAHKTHVHSVSWNSFDINLLLTGSIDKAVQMFDRRYIHNTNGQIPVLRFMGHDGPVNNVQWHPNDPWTIVSASNDSKGPGGGTLQVWRMMDLIYGEEEDEEERVDELHRRRPCTIDHDAETIRDMSLSLEFVPEEE